ncbi:MAG: SPOR domain-containing protein [Sphingomonas sp.]|nr:SPOR domain-containing protein [Sphingomonas sp.]
MISWMPGGRRSLTLLAAGTLLAAPAAAQDRNEAPSRPANLPPGAIVQPLDNGAGEELRRHIAALAENPRSISALIGAGRVALEMGDPQAALTFFSRADEIDGRDARAKAGMASAFARMERGQPALDLFAEAVALGAPEAEIAGDRGLAYDTIGDPARAQRDYAMSLRHRDDPEIRRRLAISLAISGQREAALRVIDGQLRARERAAWRTQAFVLALTGDAGGANRIVERLMPPQAAARMAPFLTQMAGLNPAEKALAAHFGHFPGNGTVATASAGAASADPGALALAQNGLPAAAARSRNNEPGSSAARRRPGATETTEEREGIGLRPSPGTRSRLEERRDQQSQTAQNDARRGAEAPAPASSPPPPAMTQAPPLARFQPNTPPDAAPGFSLTPGGPQPGEASAAPTAAAPPSIVPVQTRPFAEIAAVVNELPQDRPPPAPAAQRPAPPAAEPARPTPQRAQRQRPAQPAHPSRHWVQIAGGANKATLPREFARLRGLAPDLLGRQQAWTTPLNATNRLLVGPFPTAREAQAFVNRLAAQNLSAFAWTSPQGQEIERLQTR